MSFSSFPNAELRRQHFCKGQLWIVTRELWLTIKKSIITATFPKKFVMLRELETWPQKVRASSQAPAFPGAHLQLSHWCPATDVIHFYTLQCKGLIPISQMMKLKQEVVYLNTVLLTDGAAAWSLPWFQWLAPFQLYNCSSFNVLSSPSAYYPFSTVTKKSAWGNFHEPLLLQSSSV